MDLDCQILVFHYLISSQGRQRYFLLDRKEYVNWKLFPNMCGNFRVNWKFLFACIYLKMHLMLQDQHCHLKIVKLFHNLVSSSFLIKLPGIPFVLSYHFSSFLITSSPLNLLRFVYLSQNIVLVSILIWEECIFWYRKCSLAVEYLTCILMP